jgi:soluble P-type ATPase
VKVIQKRILNAREARPPVFRTAVMMSAAFALVLGGCSSFQLFKKLTRTNATVSGPEYVKPSDETSPSSVSIHFSNPAVRIDLIGKTADIQMKPSHPGTWTFVDDSTITFVPSQHWPAEKSYSVTLKPEFFSPSIKLDDYQVGFETAPFTVTVASSQFYIDPKDPRIKKAVITLDFSHPVDAKSISDRVSFEYKDGLLSGKPLANSVTLDATEMRAFVHSDIVSIQEKEASLVFNLKPVILATKEKVLGFVMVADEIKQESKQAVADLHKLGIKVVMLTGDDERAAKYIASLVGIDDVVAHVLPQDKLEKIQTIQRTGRVVAMAGDGVNDAPALAQADVGIAMGTGTDVAIESAGITLLGGDISKLVKAIKLSKITMRGIKQNLFWAFIYNIVGIPLAAGVFYPIFGWLLNPVFAGFAMAMSSVSVVSNSLRIKAKKL